jgi:hypothetical protein
MKLEPWQREHVKLLARAGVGGYTEEEVLRWLVQFAIFETTKQEYVRHYLEQRELLKKGGKR